MGARKYGPIEIRGEVFPDVNAAAQRFGVTPDTVRIAARNGTLHRVGTGAVGKEPMRVLIRGVLYPDAHAAAKALRVTTQAVWKAIHEGREDALGLGPRCPRPHRSRPFAIGGLSWPSMAQASVDLGFCPSYVAHSLKSGRKAALERIVAAAMRLRAQRERRAA